MRIFVKAKPGARENKIEKIDELHYTVSVKEQPVRGKANAAIADLLAEYFTVSKNQVKIVSGQFSRNKVIEIDQQLPLA